MPLLACGSNGSAQLSLHHVEDTPTLQRVQFHPSYTPHPQSEIIDLTSSSTHCLLLLHDPEAGRVLLGCGTNTVGQLGPLCQLWSDTAAPTDRFKPIGVSGAGVDGWDPVRITSTWSTSFVVFRRPLHHTASSGSGSNNTPHEESARDVVIAFGSNDFGELGTGNGQAENGKIRITKASSSGYVRVPIDIRPGEQVTRIRGGQRHVCVLLDGPRGQRVVGWGACRKGQLDPTSVSSSAASPTPGPSGPLVDAPVPQVSPRSRSSSSAATSSVKGKTSIRPSSSPPTTLPVTLDPGVRIIDIALGASHTLLLMSNGTVQGWGSNAKGQITDLHTVPSIVGIGASWNGSYFLLPDGIILSQGSNTHGQLLRTSDDMREEVEYGELRSVPRKQVTMVSGSEHLIVVQQTDRDVQLWTGGWNEHGNLGLGHTEDQPALRRVPIEGPIRRVWGGLAATWVWVDDGRW